MTTLRNWYRYPLKGGEEMRVEVILKHDKTTKGTYRYSTDDEKAVITSVYIKKSAFEDPAPSAFIKVTAVSNPKEE